MSRPAVVIKLSPTHWVNQPLDSINKLTTHLRVVSSLEMHGNVPLVRNGANSLHTDNFTLLNLTLLSSSWTADCKTKNTKLKYRVTVTFIIIVHYLGNF
jgi:hypothetical protein